MYFLLEQSDFLNHDISYRSYEKYISKHWHAVITILLIWVWLWSWEWTIMGGGMATGFMVVYSGY